MVSLGLMGQLKVLAAQPSLLWEALRAALAMRRRRRLLPSSAYLRWRLSTAYGDPYAPMDSIDLVHYLKWRKEMRRITNGGTAI